MVFQRQVNAIMAWMLCLYSQTLIAADPHPLIDPPRCVNHLGETVEYITRSTSQGQVAAGMADRSRSQDGFNNSWFSDNSWR